MNENVRLELAREEDGHGPRIGAPDDAGFHGSSKVVGEDPQAAARGRFLLLRIERHDERGRVHVDGERGPQHGRHERHELLGQSAEHDPRIGGRVDAHELFDERRQRDSARAHGGREEVLLRREVAQDGRRRNVESSSDVRERRGGEPARREGVASGGEDLFAADPRRAAHR